MAVVKDFDVLEHRRPRLGAGAEPGLMDPLCFERGKEALHGRIIETIAPPAHRWLDAMLLQHRRIRPRGVLHTAVAMMNEPAWRSAALEGHDQGVDAEPRLCGRPLRCKKNLWTAAALDRVLPCVRPLLRRLTGRGPVWEFVDQ